MTVSKGGNSQPTPEQSLWTGQFSNAIGRAESRRGERDSCEE